MVPLIIHDTNNKLKADSFIHIMRAPKSDLMVSDFPIPITIADASGNQFEAELITVAKWKLCAVSSIETFASAGLDRTAFIEKYLAETPGSTPETLIGIYVYKKVK